MNFKRNPSNERSKLVKEKKIARQGNLMVGFVILSFLFYGLVIFAPFGIYINIYLILNGMLPVNISSMEYLVLTIAMVFVIPVFVFSRRQLAQYKKLNVELTGDIEGKG